MCRKKYLTAAAVLTAFLLLLSGCSFGDFHLGAEETLPPETTAPDLSHFDGWWVLTPDYQISGSSVPTTFQVSCADALWTSYNELGRAGEAMGCAFPDGTTLVLHMGGLGDLTMLHKDGKLYDADGVTEMYEQVEKPEFMEIPDFSGAWLLNGDMEAGVSYQLTENHSQKLNQGAPVSESDYEVSLLNVSYVGGELNEKVMYLGVEWPNPDLYPSKDGLILMEEDAFDCFAYVRSDALDQVSSERLSMIKTLLDATYLEEVEAETDSGCMLKFAPNFTFHTTGFITDGGTSLNAGESALMGTWEVQEGQILVMTYNDGSQENVDLSAYDGHVNLAAKGLVFVQSQN